MSGAPTLTSPKGKGGIIAQEGFDYQIYYGLLKVAHWLADPTFEGIMFEALEDFEGRFFAPQSPQGHLLERVQAKSSSGLTRGDIVDVLDNFLEFETAFPDIVRGFELATPQFPSTLQWVHKDLERIRFAGPFYAPFRAVLDASDQAVRDKLTKEFGQARADLLFLRGTVALHTDAPLAVAYALFAAAFAATFPDAPHVSPTLFDELVKVARKSTKTYLMRAQILEVMEAGLKTQLRAQEPPCLYLMGNRPGNIPANAIRIDAAFLSGDGRFSEPAVWEDTLLKALRRVKAKWQSEAHRRIAIDGSYRLTTAFAVGALFNATSGFDLDMQTKEGVWRTDDHPSRGINVPDWVTTPAVHLSNDTLAVAIGVLRDPATTLQSTGIDLTSLSRAFLPEAVTSGQELQALVANLKQFISAEVIRLGAKRVDLYFVGPAVMALALGHRWNAISPVQTYEFNTETGYYYPTARLE